MLDIGGTAYVIDLEAMGDVLMLDKDYASKTVSETETKEIMNQDGDVINTKVITREFAKPKEYDSSKYEIIRILFEVLLTYNDEFDDTLGFDRAMAKATLPFKITFNTLLNYGIIKELED